MENVQTDKQHPGEASRVGAALGAMLFWGVGVSLMDSRFGVGTFLCAISLMWTVWLYWSDLLGIRTRTWRAWPWLGIVLIVIGIIVPCWLLVSKSLVAAATPTAEEKPTPVPVAAVQEKPKLNGPILEATKNSIIDATGAKLPADLPFKIAGAHDGSLVAMQNLEVTRAGENTWQLKPGNTELNFPYPPMVYADMPTPQLRRKIEATIKELREFQNRYDIDIRSSSSDREKLKEVIRTYAADYNTRFSELSFSLAAAAINRIGVILSMPRPASSGIQIVYYKKFVGPTPASDAAEFLDLLSNKLPKR